MRKFIPIFAIAILLPQVAFAAWWNPLSWRVFSKIFPSKTETRNEVATTTESGSEVERLLKRVEELEQKVNKQETKNPTNTQKSNPSINTIISSNTTITQTGGLSKGNIVTLVSPAVVHLTAGNSLGSGSIIEGQYILTNAHVVGKNTEVEVTFSNGKKTHATLWGIDEDIDLALLKLPSNDSPSVKIGNSSSIRQGDDVFIFGYPQGLTGEVSFKEGTISRRITEDDKTYFESSVETHPGNSGGPLINSYGEIIAVHTWKALDDNRATGLTRAIDIDYAKPFIQYMKEGRQLWKAKNSDENERLIDRELTKLYNSLNNNLYINNATQSAYDQANFVYFNNNLYKNESSIKRDYLQSLIKGVEKSLLALEVIQDLNKGLQSFTAVNGHVINNLPNIYQKKIAREIANYSSAKIKEHSDKFTEWFARKRQYENLIKDVSQVDSSYLLTQEKYLLGVIKYIETERDTLISFSSNRRLF